MMNREQFKKAADISDALADKWFPHVMATMKEFGIDTAKRQAHFIAQVGTESAGFTRVSENLNYSVEGLKIFGERLNPAQREQLGRQPGAASLSAERQAAIANLVYGGRYRNNLNGDGWKYRDCGLEQVTFRANYETCGKALNLPLLDSHAVKRCDTVR